MSTNAPSPDQTRAMYARMVLVRKTEERLSADFHAGQLPGGVHLYIGREAVAAGVSAHLTDADKIAGTHRGHGHFLAKGGDPKTMMVEVYGRENGICKGMGASMHVADISKGILGANGILGAGLAITAGAAFAAQLDGDGDVAVCFFGDGAANQGVLMETLNVTSLWKLPMFFICEHNGFSEISPAATVASGEIADRARRLYPRSRRQRDRVPAASGGRQRRGGGRLCAAPGCRRAPLMMQRHHGAARS